MTSIGLAPTSNASLQSILASDSTANAPSDNASSPQAQDSESGKKDPFPVLTWSTAGAMNSSQAMGFHYTRNVSGTFTSGEITGSLALDIETEFASGRNSTHHWDSAQNDWVQIYGSSFELSKALSESATSANGSVSQGNLEGIVVNGSFGRFESESQRNDLYQAESKEWMSTGVRSEKSVSRSASTVRLYGIEEMSSGPARFSADVTVSYNSKQLGANFKQEELLVVREAFPNGAQRELTQADWIQVRVKKRGQVSMALVKKRGQRRS